MKDHLRDTTRLHRNFKALIFYNKPLPQDRQGTDYDYPGIWRST